MISWTSQQDQSELHITRITALVVCASQQIHEYSVNIHALLISFATALETLTAVNIVNILSTWAQLEQFLQARAQPSASLVPAQCHRENLRCEEVESVKSVVFVKIFPFLRACVHIF